MKLKIGGKVYPVATQNDASLADLIAIKAATGLTRKDMRELGERVAEMSEEEAEDSDDALLATGLTVWITRRHAGEMLTLEEACAFPLAELEFIIEPGDEEALAQGLAKARKGVTPDPSSPDPEASARADGRPAATDRLPSKKKTSKRASTSA